MLNPRAERGNVNNTALLAATCNQQRSPLTICMAGSKLYSGAPSHATKMILSRQLLSAVRVHRLSLTMLSVECWFHARCILPLPMRAAHHFWEPDCSSTRSTTCRQQGWSQEQQQAISAGEQQYKTHASATAISCGNLAHCCAPRECFLGTKGMTAQSLAVMLQPPCCCCWRCSM